MPNIIIYIYIYIVYSKLFKILQPCNVSLEFLVNFWQRGNSAPYCCFILVEQWWSNKVVHGIVGTGNEVESILRPCHTRQFSLQLATQWRCIASCKEDFLVWHTMFATSLATKNCVASCRESRSSFYFSQYLATSCNFAICLVIFLRRNQSQYDIIRMPLTFLNTRRA